MPVRAQWEDYRDTAEYCADASARIRWEAMHAIVTKYSNVDTGSYDPSGEYTQDILGLLDFFENRGAWVRERFGAAVWDQMMDLASSSADRIAKLEAFFQAVPEDAEIHRLQADRFQHIRSRPSLTANHSSKYFGNWFGESVFAEGLWYIASGQSSFEVRDENDNVLSRHDLPEEIWVRDIWLAGHEIYIPCRSYCWPTLFVRFKSGTGFVARSALGHAMDPLPIGFWRDLKAPM